MIWKETKDNHKEFTTISGLKKWVEYGKLSWLKRLFRCSRCCCSLFFPKKSDRWKHKKRHFVHTFASTYGPLLTSTTVSDYQYPANNHCRKIPYFFFHWKRCFGRCVVLQQKRSPNHPKSNSAIVINEHFYVVTTSPSLSCQRHEGKMVGKHHSIVIKSIYGLCFLSSQCIILHFFIPCYGIGSLKQL